MMRQYVLFESVASVELPGAELAHVPRLLVAALELMSSKTVHPRVLSAAERAGEELLGLLLLRIVRSPWVHVVHVVVVSFLQEQIVHGGGLIIVHRAPDILRQITCRINTHVNEQQRTRT